MVQESLARPREKTRTAGRQRPSPVDRFDGRREELADAALATLAQLGFARTSLREIANNSEFTHGVLHYYFSDKTDLICCAISQYKRKCITRYDAILTASPTREALLEAVLEKVAETMREEAQVHRLWYDLRSQALFDEDFRADVVEIDRSLEAMVWRIASRFADLGGSKPAVTSVALYALLDGLFQRYLLEHLAGDAAAIPSMLGELRRLLPTVA